MHGFRGFIHSKRFEDYYVNLDDPYYEIYLDCGSIPNMIRQWGQVKRLMNRFPQDFQGKTEFIFWGKFLNKNYNIQTYNYRLSNEALRQIQFDGNDRTINLQQQKVQSKPNATNNQPALFPQEKYANAWSFNNPPTSSNINKPSPIPQSNAWNNNFAGSPNSSVLNSTMTQQRLPSQSLIYSRQSNPANQHYQRPFWKYL